MLLVHCKIDGLVATRNGNISYQIQKQPYRFESCPDYKCLFSIKAGSIDLRIE
jgi:hypothetical protein